MVTASMAVTWFPDNRRNVDVYRWEMQLGTMDNYEKWAPYSEVVRLPEDRLNYFIDAIRDAHGAQVERPLTVVFPKLTPGEPLPRGLALKTWCAYEAFKVGAPGEPNGDPIISVPRTIGFD
jgi:hypothetical protein